jgi:hypothetical protein
VFVCCDGVRLLSQHCGLGPVVLSPCDSDVDLSRRDRLGLTPNLTTRALWSEQGMGEGNEDLVYSSLWDFNSSFSHAIKSYDMGPPALLPTRNEGMLRIFIALKNPSPWPGSNRIPLGPVASTLITTPPRRLPSCERHYGRGV